MNLKPYAKIISYNLNSSEIFASAARISTTQGNACEIFEASIGNPKNRSLIEKVLSSGHTSLMEHAVFTIAFWNVSVVVEQYFIECRLASFTVKSRRYVDYSGFGYYTPPELEDSALYQTYMDRLFSAYGNLLDAGVPKEDARFLLPYSFHSSFYCTLNARELAHVLRSIRHGRGRNIPELRELADQLTAQAGELFPGLLLELDDAPSSSADESVSLFRLENAPCFVDAQDAGTVQLTSAPSAPLDVLKAAYQISLPQTPFHLEQLLTSDRPRELEQLSYSFLLSDLTLSGITHLVRHRMQSIIVPPIQSVNHSRYIVPASIKDRPSAWSIYQSALRDAHDALQEAAATPSLRKYGYYFALSGNMMDLMTTMNARELKFFLQLRTCNRAQWEIRSMAISMLQKLRAHCPELYNHFGPSCYLLGRCPEGRMTCGQMQAVRAEFSPQ